MFSFLDLWVWEASPRHSTNSQSLQYVLGQLPGKVFFEDGVLPHKLENHCTRGLQACVPTPR